MESFVEILSKIKASIELMHIAKSSRRIKLSGSIILIFLFLSAANSLAQTQTTSQPVLDHFWFDYISSPRIVDHGFYVRIVAKDQFGATYTEFSGTETLSDFTGISTSVSFSNGVCDSMVTVYSAYSSDKISIKGIPGESNPFNVMDLPVLDHFWFDYVSSPQIVGHEFYVRIVAKDQFGATYTEFSGTETLSDFTGISTSVTFSNGVGNAKVTIGKAYSSDKISIKGVPGESNTFNVTDNNLIILVVVGILVAVGIVGAVFVYLKMKKRPIIKLPAPTQLRITAEPSNLVANGEEKSVITIQLLDKEGNPMSALSDTTIRVTAAKGKIEPSVVTIPKGKDAEKTILVSSTETGPVPVSANGEGLKNITITLNFVERQRFCMHCGTRLTLKAKACQNCGKTPLAGVDTKACPNCDSVIPVAAKFCSECGAGQKI